MIPPLQRAKLELGNFLSWINQADKTVFAFDRAAWEATYARVDSRVPSVMLEYSNYGSDERCVALNKLWETKWEAENPEEAAAQRALEVAEEAKLAAPPEPKRIAAAKKRGDIKRSSKRKDAEVTSS